MSSIIPFPQDAEQYSKEETERKLQLFAWANRVLRDLGFADRIKQAASLEELRKVIFDHEAADVILAIRAALHPTTGTKADFFQALREGALKQILKKCFGEMKSKRETELQQSGGSRRQQSDAKWVLELKLSDKGKILPILTNLILYLTHHPKWTGVLGYDEFATCVVIRKQPPWGQEADGTHYTDHHESLTRVWFQREDINAGLGDIGRAIQAAARNNTFHPVRDYLDSHKWDGTPRLDTWLIDHCHADDTLYTRTVGQRFLISAAGISDAWSFYLVFRNMVG